MAAMFDPTTGANEGLIAKLLFWIALMLFFQTGMYEMTLVILVKSFTMINLGTFDIFSYDGIQLAINEIKRMFALFCFCFSTIFYRIHIRCLLWLWNKINAFFFSFCYNFSAKICFNLYIPYFRNGNIYRIVYKLFYR